ncbi:MAG TPA: type II secretion system F family protein, partial [Candidatus Omnitrophota bacterium]|nr:type II secretion system F family protein [Candidatus Omnitrophota bacterium]
MKAFTYKAKTGPDQIVEGKIYANTVQEVVDNLHNRGWTATNVQEMHMEEQKGVVSAGVNRFLGVRLKELISFSRQLANLIKSGLPILQALSVLQDQTRDPHFKHVIGDIAENVKHGQTVSSGLREYGRVFPSFYRAMLSAGENSGAIDVALNRIADYYTKRYQLVSKIKSALAYPILILVVGALTLVFIFTNVIPRVIPLLVNLNMKLPLPTRMLIWMSDFLRNNWMWVLLWVFIFFLIFERSLKNKIFAYHFSKFKLSIPVFG